MSEVKKNTDHKYGFSAGGTPLMKSRFTGEWFLLEGSKTTGGYLPAGSIKPKSWGVRDVNGNLIMQGEL